MVWNIVLLADNTLTLVPDGDPIPSGGTVTGQTNYADYLTVPYVDPISKLAFLNRFTDAELIAIELAKPDNPNATQAARELAAALRIQQHKFDVASYIDLAHQQTHDGLDYLEAQGLIGTGRAAQIYNTQVTEAERP